MTHIARLLSATVTGLIACAAPVFIHSGAEADPVFENRDPCRIPRWTMIFIASVGDPVSDLRVKLGNDVAVKAFRDGTLPFRTGQSLRGSPTARSRQRKPTPPSSRRRTGGPLARTGDGNFSKSFVAGPQTNVQFIVKDSGKYASTGGWGFAQFPEGKPENKSVQSSAFLPQARARTADNVFTAYEQHLVPCVRSCEMEFSPLDDNTKDLKRSMP